MCNTRFFSLSLVCVQNFMSQGTKPHSSFRPGVEKKTGVTLRVQKMKGDVFYECPIFIVPCSTLTFYMFTLSAYIYSFDSAILYYACFMLFKRGEINRFFSISNIMFVMGYVHRCTMMMGFSVTLGYALGSLLFTFTM